MNNNVQAVLHRLQNSKALMLDFLCSLTFLSAFFPTYKSFEKVVHNCINTKVFFIWHLFLFQLKKASDPPYSEESRKDSFLVSIEIRDNTLWSKGIHAQQKLWKTLYWLWNKNSFGLLYFVQNCLMKSICCNK